MINSLDSILLPNRILWSPAQEIRKARLNNASKKWDSLTTPFDKQDRFFKRIESLRLATHQCLITDNRLADFDDAERTVIEEMGPEKFIIRSADLIVGEFPPRGLILEFRTLVQVVGMQPPVGAWSIIQMDLLTLYKDNEYIFTDVFPELVLSHPVTILNKSLSEAQLLQYRTFFADASSYFKLKIETLKSALDPGQINQNASAAGALGILAAAFSVYSAIEWFVDTSLDVMRRQEAAEKKAAELAAQAEKYKKDIEKAFKPLPDAERWLNKFLNP